MTDSGSNEPPTTFDYVQFVKDTLQLERDTWTSIRQRSIAVVTTAGTLVTLFTAFTSTGKLHGLRSASGAVIGTLAFFVFAAIFGIATNGTLPDLQPDNQEQIWRQRKTDIEATGLLRRQEEI